VLGSASSWEKLAGKHFMIFTVIHHHGAHHHANHHCREGSASVVVSRE
jgi:hypothetical protein